MLRLKGYDYAKIKQKMAKQLKKTKIPGLGRGGLAWPESESARNFMDKCVYEKCSAIFFFFSSRMDLPPAGQEIHFFTFLNKNYQIWTQNDQKCQIGPK